MALSEQDLFLGRALLAWGLVDRDHLVACAEDVQRYAAQGQRITLGQVLLKHGLLSVERYQAIVARLRQVYLAGGNSGAPSQVQQATAAMPQLSGSGRYEQQPDAPRLDESSVDRAVQRWQQVGPQVTAPRNDNEIDIEFDLGIPIPAASAAHRPSGSMPAARSTPPTGRSPPPPDAPQPKGAPAKEREQADAFIRKRLKVPLEADRFVLGDWMVEQYLAEGAWGVVYKVSRKAGGDPTPFALKVLKHAEPSRTVRERFVQEARTMAKLSHPGIVHVHDAGVAASLLWFVMDFQPGKSLQKMLDEQGKLPLADGLRMIDLLCDAVSYAHSHAILHRDLKPENIIMSGGRDPVLTDFGLAKDKQSNLNLTTEGQRIGTPLYMAPELLMEGEQATAASEVYALGAILYQVLAGKVPFMSKSVVDLVALIEKGEMTPLKKIVPEASAKLDKVVGRALHMEMKRRQQSVQELRDELKQAR